MADLLQDFEAYFIAQGLIVADEIFFEDMQDLADSAVALYEYTGSSPIPQVAGVSRSIQVVVRNLSLMAAKARASAFYKSLMTEDGILELTDERWTMIHLRQPPFKLKVDEKKRNYYAFNIGVTTYID